VVDLGAAGTVLLRVASAALLLMILFGRQRTRLSRRHLGLVVLASAGVTRASSQAGDGGAA